MVVSDRYDMTIAKVFWWLSPLLLGAALLAACVVEVSAQDAAQPVGGVVRPLRKAVLSFARDGLATYLVREGATVAKGEILGRLDIRHPAARVGTARVEVEAAQAALDEAAHDRDVQRDLLAADIITEEAFRNLEFKVRYMEIKLKSARQALHQAQLDLDDSLLAAPFAGIVVNTAVQQSEWVGKGKPVIELADATHLELSTDVPLAQTRGLGVGVKTQLLDGDAIVGEAVVRVMQPMLDPASGLRRVIWDVTPKTDVLAGRYVYLKPWE